MVIRTFRFSNRLFLKTSKRYAIKYAPEREKKEVLFVPFTPVRNDFLYYKNIADQCVVCIFVTTYMYIFGTTSGKGLKNIKIKLKR